MNFRGFMIRKGTGKSFGNILSKILGVEKIKFDQLNFQNSNIQESFVKMKK